MPAPILDRPKSPDDWSQLREICVETAAREVAPGQREAFGRLWIDPYRRWAPGWAYVARRDGRVAGYLTGCASSARFYAASLAFGPRPRLGSNLRFPAALLARLLWSYPAHLHVNVRAAYRGGTGRALVERFEADLRASGAAGLHVFCGAAPVGFYLKLGFRELGRLQAGPAPIYALGKSLR